MKDEKKKNRDGDENTKETAGGEQQDSEQPEKRACLDDGTEEEKPVGEQNGIDEPEPMDNDAEDVQEIKVNIPMVVVADEGEAKSATINEFEVEAAESNPIKETPFPAKLTTKLNTH